MNLYRSFGNLMEAWVTEGRQCSDSESLGNNDEDSPTPSSDMGTNLRSESVDSGVETVSSDTSFHAISCSISTDHADIDTFTPEREVDGLSQASASQSPVLFSPPSSSSLLPCPSGAQESSLRSHQKLEQALQRVETKLRKNKPAPLTVDEVLRRRLRHSSLPKWHTSEVTRGQRSDSFVLRRTVDPLMPTRQMCRRPTSLSFDTRPTQESAKTRSEDFGKEEGKELSPGLSYLEQVCQMLEDIARKQMHNQALQMEMKALRDHQDVEALNACQAAEEDLSACQRLENTQSLKHSSSLPQQRKDYPYRHFRQRSASDTTIAALHLKKLNADCRGQHLSIDDLLEMAEENHEEQESKKEKTNKTSKIWKFKVGSLKRNESAAREINGQQTQSSEKTSARRRLSQLFRRNRRKTLPA